MSEITLRPHQQKFISDIARAFAEGSTAPIGVAPTGMGKTVCLAYMANGARKKGNTVGITVHRKELLSQTSIALAAQGVYHGLIAADKDIRACISHHIEMFGRSYFNADSGVHLCSVQTAARRIDAIEPFDYIMIDEAHHAVAGQWSKFIDAMPNAKMLGVTATPERLDGKGLGIRYGGCFSSLVMGPTVQELIDLGYLAPPRVFAPPVQFDAAAIRTRGGDYDGKSASLSLDKPTITGDAIAHYRRICDGVPAIAFCASVEHARHVADQFAASGYRAACIDGEMDDRPRRDAIAGLGDGRIQILTSCEIVSEGTDIPIVGAAIFLRPTRSLGMYLQQGGRVLRPYEGKECAYILDHVGNSLRHGLLEDDREWSLEGRKKRARASDDERAPSVAVCLECYAAFASHLRRCPMCGHVRQVAGREIEEQDGELVEIQQSKLKFERRREQAMAQSLDDLIALGKRRGMKNPAGWARHVWNARQQRRTA